MQSNSSKEIVVKTLVNGEDVNPDLSVIPFNLAGDRTLIEPIEPDKFFPDDGKGTKIEKPIGYKEPFLTGIVKCIGGGEYGTSIPKSLKPNQIVYYWHQQKMDLMIDKALYHLVRVSDVWGKP